MSKHNRTRANSQHKEPEKKASPRTIQWRVAVPLLMFLAVWCWASWWMGDVWRVARERSFFAPDLTLMGFLWQQSHGSLWLIGRAWLTLFRWPWLGGCVVALVLALGSWLVGYCLRLGPRWRWLQYLPAGVWMLWVSWIGLELYYQHESGRALGILFLAFLVVAVDGFVISTFSRKPLPAIIRMPKDESLAQNLSQVALVLALVVGTAAIGAWRHPYLRPLTRMEVQLLQKDYQGAVQTAQEHATLSYRPLAAYYAIALVHTGRLTEDLFQIRMDYDSLKVNNRSGFPDNGNKYYLADCNYHAGLFRAAGHNAMEDLTMNGPTLYSLKHLTRLALLDGDWALARKYLFILQKEPFEKAWTEPYEAMVGNDEAVAADPEFALLRLTEPLHDSFESQYEQPCFLGYTATLMEGRSMEALTQSLMANLYSKRMPDFLMRCQPLAGQVPPTLIGQGLTTQIKKNPAIQQAFPSLEMDMRRYATFLQAVSPYIKDRPAHARQLFDQFQGYYPYYYFFGNLKATRKKEDNKAQETSNAGVN